MKIKRQAGWLIVVFLGVFSLSAQIREPELIPFQQENTILLKTAGGFNFDNDEMLEVVGIAARTDERGSILPRTTFLVYLEVSISGDFNVLWKFALPENIRGDFTDILITDCNGDGRSEIAATLNFSEVLTGPAPPWLYLFEYNDGFPASPSASLTGSGDVPGRIRPAFLQKGDFNGDRTDELIITSTGPNRSVSVIGLRDSTLTFLYQTSRLDIISGVHPFRAFAVDANQNPGTELVIWGGRDQIQVEIMSFEPDVRRLQRLSIRGETRNNLDINAITPVDLDGDGQMEWLVPLRGGGIYIVRHMRDELRYRLFFPKQLQLGALTVADLNANGLTDIIIRFVNENHLTVFEYDLNGSPDDLASYRKSIYDNPSLRELNYQQIALVYSYSMNFTGAVIIPFVNPAIRRNGLCYWALEDIVPLTEGGLVDEVLEEIDAFLAQKDTTVVIVQIDEPAPAEKSLFADMDSILQQFSDINGEEIDIAPLAEITEKPKPISLKDLFRPDVLAHSGEHVTRRIDVPGLTLDDLVALNTSVKMPPGMRFDLPRFLFTWVPADTQLGPHRVSADFTWGKNHIKREFTLYINDPPKIMNDYRKRDVIQIGETFQMTIDVADRNTDAAAFFKLLRAPAGVTISENGAVFWKPSFDQIDWHDVVVEVFDGYDRAQIEFALFVNHPVSIESAAPNLIQVGREYTYNPIIQDKNKGAFLPGYTVPPRIEDWQSVGIYEYAVLEDGAKASLGNQIEAFRRVASSDARNPIREAVADDSKLILVFNRTGKTDPPPADLVKYIFTQIGAPPPRLTKGERRYVYEFQKNEGPEGLTLFPEGRFHWIPTNKQFDFQTLSYSVSDGFFTCEEHAQIYVNVPPTIVSTPDSSAYVGTQWQYEIKVSDLNTDRKIKYTLLNGPDGMVLSPQGILSWRPAEHQLNIHRFEIKVTDGMASDGQKGRIFVNVKPRILSVPKPVAVTGLKYEYQLDAEDPNGDPMVFKAIRLPKYATFDAKTGLLVWEPRKSQKGVNDMVFEVTDTHGWSSVQESQVHVFHNPSTKRLSFLRDTISLMALIGVIVIAASYAG